MNCKKLLLVFLLIPILCSCSKKTYTRSNLAFDTVVTLTLYDGGSDEILDRAFETVGDLNSKLDSFDNSSEVARISQNKMPLSEDTYSLLKSNLEYSNLTGGAVRPTLGRLIKLWNINEPEVREAPTEDEVSEALAGTETENLVLDETDHSAILTSNLTQINLGASSKGFAADKLKKQLMDEGVTSAIINLGGNVLTIGDKNGEDFAIGIDNPKGEEDPIAVLKVRDKSVVTSGVYQRYFTSPEGKRYHHILDPQTGYPVENGLDEVVVVSDSSLEGDLLSTALFVMGFDKSREFLNRYDKDIGVIFIYSNGKIFLTKNLKSNFTLEPNYRESYQVEYF